MIELRMLGEIHLRSADGTPLEGLLRQPKRLALLAYLAAPAPGTWHRRDMVLALFWPELDTTHARTSLRNALYVIRQALGERIVRNRGDEEISVDPAELRTDLASIWEALREGPTADALSLYGGDLLPGLIPPDSDGFMRWLDAERTRLKVAVSAAAIARSHALEQRGDVPAALAVARRVMEIQPDDETIVRRLMSLHETMGDRAGALATFEGYRARLGTEFGAEPSPETMAVATRLRAPGPRPVAAAPARVVDPVPLPSAASVGVERAATPPFEIPGRAVGRPLALAVAVTLAIVTVAFGAWRMTRPELPMAIVGSAPLTADEGLQVGTAISPNGRMIAYAKGSSRSLQVFVQKIGGGEPWRLTTDSTSTELMPRWSPDSDQLLYLARDGAYVSPSIGGTARLVARGTEGDGKVRSASWSPNGDSVAIVRNDSLIVQPLVGAGSRFVAVAQGRQLHSCVWSPTGTWIACVAGNQLALEPGPLFGNEAPSAIVVYRAEGGSTEPVEITGNEFQHESPAWSSDGDFLWLVSNRDGTPGDAYAVPIGRDGRASGPFVRIGLSAESIDLSSDRIAYSVPVRRANIWSVPIPGAEMTALTTVGRRVTSGTHLIELVYASPDGKWLVYDSNIHGNADIFRIAVTGGAAERLTDDPRPEYAGDLSPDGRELAWQRFVDGRRRVFVRRLDSDSAHEIVRMDGDQGVPHWSPDGQALVAWSHDREAGAVFVVRRDREGGWSRPAWRLEGGQTPVWSPDGRTIAYIRYDGGVETIPADSGARREIYSPRPGSADPLASHLVWTIDPAVIWFIGSNARGEGGIWSVPAPGGEPRLRVRFDDVSGRAHGPSLTTDGSRFYFTLDERFSNVRWGTLVRR